MLHNILMKGQYYCNYAGITRRILKICKYVKVEEIRKLSEYF